MSVLSDMQFSYSTLDTGAAKDHHVVTATHPEHGEVGRMQWSHRNIQGIDVEQEHSRQGVASAMWDEGHRLAEQNARIPQPKHSPDRTHMGDSWARSVGGRLPRRTR